MNRSLTLRLMPDDYAIVGFPVETAWPAWARPANILQLSRAADELTVVVAKHHLPPGDAGAADAWRALEVTDTFDFNEPGILASVLTPLTEAGIGIFAFSTFSTDCVLVQASDLDAALAALAAASHIVSPAAAT